MASKEEVYGAFVDYYSDIPLAKIKEERAYRVYSTRVSTSLGESRYIFVVAKAVDYNRDSETLNNIDWISFQTRITSDHHPNVPIINLELTENKKRVMSDNIYVVNRSIEKTEYLTRDLPIKISLMHDPRKNNSLQYPDNCALYKALETYQCVVELL